MSFRSLDHTADLRLEIEAASRDELFAEAAMAFTECLTDPAAVEARVSRAFLLAAADPGTLMVDWLTELVVAFEVDGFLVARSRVAVAERAAGLTLTAEAWGEARDDVRHPIKTLVKGVTYNELEVGPAGAAGWRARITLDL